METQARLGRAQRDQTMVRIVRSLKHADTIDGFIVAVGEGWTVVQGTREGGYFDGYSAFRLDDIKKVRKLEEDFAGRFSRTLPTWPPRCPEALELDSTVSVVSSMANTSGLIGIEQEGRLSATWIGRLREVTRKRTTLLELRPDGSWRDESSVFRTKEITLVSIDTMYQHALATVVKPPSGRDSGR